MSGIYIPGVKIPKRCEECQFLAGDEMDGLCHAADRWLDDEGFTWYVYEEDDIDTSKPANCPLVAVPDHHDLIDINDLKLALMDIKFEDNASKDLAAVFREINLAKTIIPADKEGE